MHACSVGSPGLTLSSSLPCAHVPWTNRAGPGQSARIPYHGSSSSVPIDGESGSRYAVSPVTFPLVPEAQWPQANPNHCHH